jgi:hypothetical protein
MWLWASALIETGFRRKAERYWRCERRFGLPPHAHLSLFSWGEHALPSAAGPAPLLVELTEFHVTFVLGNQHVHFYYHERQPNDWDPAGHTSRRELRRLGADRAALRAQADAVAAAVVAALGGTWHPRALRRM